MTKNSELANLREEVATNEIEYSDRVFEHHRFASLNAETDDHAYIGIKTSIEDTCMNDFEPVLVTKDGLLFDGRTRQKALSAIGSAKIPFRRLKKDYSDIVLMEWIMSKHTGKKETKTQLAIKGFRWKRTIVGVTYESAAVKVGCSKNMIKNVSKLYTLMETNGFDPEELFDTIMSNIVPKPVVFPWVEKPSSSIANLIEQFEKYLFIENLKRSGNYDPTEQKIIIDEDTGERKIVNIEKMLPIDSEPTVQELLNIIESLNKKIEILEGK